MAKKKQRKYSISENYFYSFILLGILFSLGHFLIWNMDTIFLSFRIWLVMSIVLGTIVELDEIKKERK